MEDVHGQLQTKYHKIVTEYSKIRAQANVLKNAVIEEQKRNADIREQLKEKEVELRKAEQELDSLSFRNQQLTKRITVLQEELDKTQIKSKKGKSKLLESNSQIPVHPNHILDEEFKKKIVENAQLLSQISDKDSEIESLNNRIQELQYKLDHCEKSKVELECQYQSTIEKLERERNDLQKKLNEKQKQEETVSWSSNEGKREGYDFDTRLGLSNHRQTELSPFSSPLASRRSSKSIGEGKPHKTQEETNEFEFSKLCDIEKEMNYWKAQYHILKIKCDEVEQKDCLNSVQIENEPLQLTKIDHMIGRLTVPFAIPEEIEAREAKIRDYFLQEIDKLIMEKHIYHAKNLAMAANSEVMQVHLDASESKRKKCESALTEANWNTSERDKEIQENYKTQLITMSEHLANMNEKLISQTEEIQHLKFELVKNNKKGKQK
ncbi:protein phosphatase 1 regulatory subunit 21 [Hylaeus volcanicus]|uniref:protein phosphatase 1 regulatory subunit 21 n=1 Tax=Hylaeus volcanicus TaxID=313075 RepID=UPI0023B881F5|nr:protein phosphatase 1 regulatory subunit 21 [Hylaeus volcanicus]XP_053976436.1 protein phosphatase 1 regulatory subunit 21 [Hylaeus volcanicus]XP_053976437.1 protein phosphatase 1 regulatory subunit 21 [Hylaeus volcanicus]